MMRITVVFLLFFLLLPFAGEAGYDARLGWRTIETPHFALHFPKNLKVAADRSAILLERTYDRMTKQWGVAPWGRTQVVLTDHQDKANGMATVYPYNMIILHLTAPHADSSLATYDDWLEELIVHEYTHILHLSDAGYPMKLLKFIFGKIIAPNGLTPGWVTEGMATYFETAKTDGGRGRSSFAEMMLRTDVLNDEFLPIDKASGEAYDWPAWLVRYIYGVKFWQHLSQKYGEEKMVEFSHKMGASPLLFMANRQAKRVFGKSFYKLWREWKSELVQKYQKEKNVLEAKGLVAGEPIFKQEGRLTSPLYIELGSKIIYLRESSHHRTALWSYDTKTGQKKRLLEKFVPRQLSWHEGKKQIAFSILHSEGRFNNYSDLYLYDIEKKKLQTLTKGKRARDPDFSPDGSQIIFSMHEPLGDKLALIDVKSKAITFLTDPDPYVMMDHPRWSPRGKTAAVSVWRPGLGRGIEIFNIETGSHRRITSTREKANLARHPSWGPQGRFLYYSSNQTGISNIYRYDTHKKHHQQLTRVLTGAFRPTVDPQGQKVVYQYYVGNGYEIRSFDLSASLSEVEEPFFPKATSNTPRHESETHHDWKIKKYTPFKTLFLPRYMMPNVAFLDNAIFASAMTGSFDPLVRHNWFANATFRSDNNFIGYGGGYSYHRWWPSLYTGYLKYATNFGNIFGTGTDYFEKRWRVYGGTGIAFKGKHSVNLTYFFEDRSAESGVPATATVLPVVGNFAGLKTTYSFGSTGQTVAGISPEWGQKLKLNFEITDELMGASSQLERRVVWGEGRQYFKVPGTLHNVVALRLAGGISFGDALTQGSFGLGGSLGESPIASASTRVFTMRGMPLVTFSRERVMIFSTEYRFPLFRTQRGLGTTPFFLRSAHMALFSDAGDAWNANQKTGGFKDFVDDFMVSVGAELRADFVLGYAIPIQGRLGYGILVVNGDRITGVADTLTKADARNGVIIVEFGASF